MYLCNDMTFTNDFVIYDQKVQWDFWSALLPFKGKCHFNTEKIQFKVQTTCVVCGWVGKRARASNFNGKNTFFCSHYIYYKIMVKFTSNVNFSFKAFFEWMSNINLENQIHFKNWRIISSTFDLNWAYEVVDAANC